VYVVTIVLSVLLAVAFLGAGGTKLAGLAMQRGNAEHLNIPYVAYRGIGALEVAGALGLLIGLAVPALGIAAAIGLVLLMIGAAIAHLRNGDGINAVLPSVILFLLAAATLVTRALSS